MSTPLALHKLVMTSTGTLGCACTPVIFVPNIPCPLGGRDDIYSSTCFPGLALVRDCCRPGRDRSHPGRAITTRLLEITFSCKDWRVPCLPEVELMFIHKPPGSHISQGKGLPFLCFLLGIEAAELHGV
jgi:hypothetical protein